MSGHKQRFPFIVLVGLLVGLAGSLWQRRERMARAARWRAGAARRGPGRALITGASSGIGAAFARRLARDGYHLVLTARRAERLRALADEITTFHAVEVEVLPADLDQPADLERLERRIQAADDLSLLVNNAGFGAGGPFLTSKLERELAMVRVHVLASMRLIRAALPGMLARRHGAILNVSSLGGFLPMPGNGTYGATKSYLTLFSQSLDLELAGSGVRVQALCPGMTRSEFHATAGVDTSQLPDLAWMTAEEVVEESLRGLQEDRVVVIPGRLNQWIYLLSSNPFSAPLMRLAVQAARRFGRLQVLAPDPPGQSVD